MTQSATLAGVKVGDEIMVSTFGRPAKPESVTAIGRKLLTTSSGLKFRIEDGSYNSEYSGIAMTVGQYRTEQERDDLESRLAGQRVVVYGSRLTVEQLRAIYDIVFP